MNPIPVNDSRQLRLRIIALKREHTHCPYCDVLLTRASVILDGQPLTKKMIEKMSQPIHQQDWLIFKSRLTVLCRFCCERHAQPEPVYFDLVSFQHYLRSHALMKPSAIREYLVRLRRIDNDLISVNFTQTAFAVSAIERELENTLTRPSLKNVRCALHKYAEYLATRETGVL